MSITFTGPGMAGKAVVFLQEVYFEGSQTLEMGVAVCFNRLSGTATVAEQNRDARVTLPDNTDNNAFAGVTTRRYVGKVGGQWIQIARPGSVVPVRFNAAQNIGQNTIGTFTFSSANGTDANAGIFRSDYAQRPVGAGSVRVLQTIAVAGLALCKLEEGEQNGGVELFTAAASAVVATTGVTVITRDASNRSLTQLAAGTHVGQRKLIRCIGATTTTVTIPLGAAGGKRRGTGASAPEQLVAGFNFANIVFPSGGANANAYVLLEWTGTQWFVIDTNLLAADFT